ncbi:uncharacterized protein LOC133498203 [Syngnathoides biaculeatus]|uniref:uncharacterized protein LOC133498203 n=1 Tax=Syngnathoides biaculeatus TaxID=300417 RepID=UPI002ADD3E4A|nr:uncharacterized protein LOC133498203 [Syngnathoides biaculeatus]
MTRWNFPHCCGALDGKHVACSSPNSSGSTYYNYKGFYSVVILALMYADYKFFWADVDGKGAVSDAQIYNGSELKECIDDGSIGCPPAEPLPNNNEDVPYYLIGDDAFALRSNMIKRYLHRGMIDDERGFNYRLSRARCVVENAFCILANSFQVLLTTMSHSPATVRVIVITCLCLHNLMRIRYPRQENIRMDREDDNHQVIRGQWRKQHYLEDTINVRGPNVNNREGKRQSNLLKHWCNSEAGAVPWQLDMIRKM